MRRRRVSARLAGCCGGNGLSFDSAIFFFFKPRSCRPKKRCAARLPLQNAPIRAIIAQLRSSDLDKPLVFVLQSPFTQKRPNILCLAMIRFRQDGKTSRFVVGGREEGARNGGKRTFFFIIFMLSAAPALEQNIGTLSTTHLCCVKVCPHYVMRVLAYKLIHSLFILIYFTRKQAISS